MADQQGTGKHPHKSAAEPYEHHEAATTKGEHKSESHGTASHSNGGSHASASSHSGEQGTGKHPHKSAEAPRSTMRAPRPTS